MNARAERSRGADPRWVAARLAGHRAPCGADDPAARTHRAGGRGQGASGLARPELSDPTAPGRLARRAGPGAASTSEPASAPIWRPSRDRVLRVDFPRLSRRRRTSTGSTGWCSSTGGRFLAQHGGSLRWMVHYANADMGLLTPGGPPTARRRAARWPGFDEGFAARRTPRRSPTSRRVRAGSSGHRLRRARRWPPAAVRGRRRHDRSTRWDPENLYPYKRPAMQKLFAAFVTGARGSGDVAFVTTMPRIRPILHLNPPSRPGRCRKCATRPDTASQMCLRKFL